MNNLKLKGLMAERGITQRELSTITGIAFSTLIRKIKDLSFNRNELESIAKGLKLSQEEFISAFFPNIF